MRRAYLRDGWSIAGLPRKSGKSHVWLRGTLRMFRQARGNAPAGCALRPTIDTLSPRLVTTTTVAVNLCLRTEKKDGAEGS